MFLRHQPYPILLTLIAGALCVALDLTGRKRSAGVCKLLAAVGFVTAAVSSPLASSSYGHRIVVGAIAGALGDAALISRRSWALVCGIALFLLGHVSYMQAMLLWGFNRLELGSFFLMMLAIVSVIKAWLWPTVPQLLRPFVLMYMVATALLVACTVACSTNHPRPIFAVVGVLSFFIADIFVAQERFVRTTKLQTLIGLPLYWLAQWCIVSTMGVS